MEKVQHSESRWTSSSTHRTRYLSRSRTPLNTDLLTPCSSGGGGGEGVDGVEFKRMIESFMWILYTLGGILYQDTQVSSIFTGVVQGECCIMNEH